MSWELLIDIVLAVVLVIVTRYAVPWLQGQLSARNREDLAKLIGDLVAAAEQVFAGSGRGTDKKAYVVEELNLLGYSIDGETDAMIEAAVYRLDGGSV